MKEAFWKIYHNLWLVILFSYFFLAYETHALERAQQYKTNCRCNGTVPITCHSLSVRHAHMGVFLFPPVCNIIQPDKLLQHNVIRLACAWPVPVPLINTLLLFCIGFMPYQPHTNANPLTRYDKSKVYMTLSSNCSIVDLQSCVLLGKR